MADQNEDKDWQLDALLDSLLRSYSAADPRPGFETRVRALVTERATRVRRTNMPMLAASAAAIVLFAWIMIAKTHQSKTHVAGPAIAHNSSAATMDSGAKIVIHVTPPAENRRTLERAANIRNDKVNQIVLQMVASTEGSKSLVFEHEKLYLTPEAPAETETTAEAAPAPAQTEDTQATGVSIRSIGVASIESNAPVEIKDLAPPKSSTEKGSL
jgi:uncharacterized protein (DUF1778 family)